MSDIPKARVVKIGPAPERIDDFKPADAFDVSDENPAMLANHMRALQGEMRSGFELLNERLIPMITRIEEKLDDLGVRLTRVEKTQVEQAREQKRLSERIDALEAKRPKQRARR